MPGFTAPTDDGLTLRTERLVLRPVRPSDAEAMFEHCGDPDLPRLMTWPAHESVDVTRRFLSDCMAAREEDRDYVWGVLEDDALRGLVGIEGVVRRPLGTRFDRAELGYWIGIPFHGRGLATEAAGAAIACAFTRLALHKVTVHAFTTNTASLRVIEKLGFTQVGVKRRDVCKEGVWHDQVALELLADDPAAARLILAARSRLS